MNTSFKKLEIVMECQRNNYVILKVKRKRGRKMKKLLKIALLASCTLLVACGGQANNGGDTPTVVKTDEEYSTFANINNAFAYQTFRDLTSIDDSVVLRGGENDFFKGDNLIYSPYSYEGALATLMHFTDGYDDDEKLKSFVNLNPADYYLNNLQSQNIFIANKGVISGESDDELFHKLGFPDEAEEKSREMQNKMFGRILLEPKYKDDISAVVINVTKFLGQWTQAFNESYTESGTFTKLDGSEMEAELMKTTFWDSHGYEDDVLTMTKKSISTEEDGVKSEEPTSDVYIMVPKYGDDKLSDLKGIIENLETYIEDYESVKEHYGKVKITLPKLETKTVIDLGAFEDEIGSSFIEKEVFLNKNMTKPEVQGQIIKDITQVASLKMDEKEVKAEAITEIQVETTAVAVPDETELEVIADVPYLLVITSRHNNENIISFMAYINNPEVQ